MNDKPSSQEPIAGPAVALMAYRRILAARLKTAAARAQKIGAAQLQGGITESKTMLENMEQQRKTKKGKTAAFANQLDAVRARKKAAEAAAADHQQTMKQRDDEIARFTDRVLSVRNDPGR
jgi:hypothetical protein